MQPNSPPLSPSSISRFSSPCTLPDHLTAAILVLVNKPDTHFYPVFHVQRDPPPDISGVDTMGQQITAYDQIIMGSDTESDLRMFFAEPKHCSLVVDSLGRIYVLNFSSSNPCLLNSATLATNTLHYVVDRDIIHVAGKDFRVEYKSGYPISATEATHEDTPTQLSDTIELPEDSLPVENPSHSPISDKVENISYSLPKIDTTPTPQKSGTVPHDTTDNSYASMEGNTSQPSLVVRDMSTIIEPSPRERRRVSDPLRVQIQSPIKLKRKSAPVFHAKTPRSLYKPMDTSDESPAPRRSHRLVRSPTPPNKRSSPRYSATMQSPKQFPSTFKHPHSTTSSAKKSKSPLALGHRKSVRFGPSLSPEEFHRDMPPSTPVKRGGTPIPKSATKAVYRRSTPYKVPLPLSAQRATRATKSTSPDDSFKTPKFSLSSPKLKTPKSQQTLSPVREVPQLQNPSKQLVNERPMLRRRFTTGVVAEMVESQSFKLSSRISTPTSMHSKQPVKLLDKGTPAKRGAKVPSLATSHSFVPKSADSEPQLSPEATGVQQTPKRKFVSYGNQTGQKESPKLKKRSPRFIQGNSSGELESQRIQRQSPRLSKSPVILQSTNPSNLSARLESPLSMSLRSPSSDPGTLAPKLKSPSPHQMVPTLKVSPKINQSNSKVNTPKFLSKSTPKLNSPGTPRTPGTPGPSSQRKSVQIARTSSVGDTLAHPRVSSRISGSGSPTSPRPNSQIFSPPEHTPNISRSPAEFYKTPNGNQRSPAVNQKSPAVNQTSPAVNQKSPAVNQTSPAVNQKSPTVSPKSPAVNQKSPTVSPKSPAVNQRYPAVNQKSPAVNQKSPAVSPKPPAVSQKSTAVVNQKSPAVSTKSPAVNQKSSAVSKSPADFYKTRTTTKSPIVVSPTPAVIMKFPAVTVLNKPRSTKKSPAVLSKSPADTPKRLKGRPRKSAPAILSSRTPISLRPHVSPANSPSPPLLHETAPQAKSPLARVSPRVARVSPRVARVSPRLARMSPRLARVSPRVACVSPPLAQVSPRLARVSPPRALLSPQSVRDTQGRLLRIEDVFNPNIFQTPKSKYRTSQAEANFSPSLFDTPKSPRGSKRSISAPPDTSPATLSQSKRSRSLPVAKEPRKKNTAVPEDTFVPYLFRTPRAKPVRSPIRPEDHFSPGMFRTPPTPLLSPGKGVKRPMSQRGRKPTKQKRGVPKLTPESSPLPIRDLRPPVTQPERPRQLLKRGVDKKATSSPAKVVIISSPPKPPATQRLDSSPFVIRTSLRSDSPSPVPIRVTRGRPSKQKNVAPAKPSVKSPIKKPAKLKSPVPEPSPVMLRGNRQRYASSKPIILNKETPPRVPRAIRSKKLSPLAPNTTKSILKTPSKRQVFSPGKDKIDIPVSPTVAKLRNPRKTGRVRTVAVAFTVVPVSPRRSSRLK